MSKETVSFPSYTAQATAKNLDIATGVFGGLSGVTAVFTGYKKYQYNRITAAVGPNIAFLNNIDVAVLEQQMVAGVRLTTMLGGIAIVLSASKDAALVPPNDKPSRKKQVATGVLGKLFLAAGPNIITLGGYRENGTVQSPTAYALGIILTVSGLALIGVSEDVGDVVNWDTVDD